QRLGILQKPLNELEAVEDPGRTRVWRDRVNQMYQRGGPKEAGWLDDRFFLSLLEARSDVSFREVKELTIIVLNAVRKPIAQDMYYLLAATEQEEAEQAHARRQAGGKGAVLGLTIQW